MANITFNEQSGLTNTIFGKFEAPIRRTIEKRAEAFENESVTDIIFNKESSKHYAEAITSLTGMDGFEPVGELGKHPWTGMKEGFKKTIEHMVWKNRFSISREIIDDAQAIELRKRPEAFVTAYYRMRERFGAALIGGAIGGSSYISYGTGENAKTFDTTTADGQPLFSTGHLAAASSKTQSNKFADAFSLDALTAAETAMQSLTGDNDEELEVSPDTIIIPNDWQLKKAVFAAVGSDKDPETANNGFNMQFGRWNVIIWQYLNRYITSGVSPWILMDSDYNRTYSGAVNFERVPLEVTTYEDRDTNAAVWDGYARFGMGFGDFRAFAVGGISGGTQLISE